MRSRDRVACVVAIVAVAIVLLGVAAGVATYMARRAQVFASFENVHVLEDVHVLETEGRIPAIVLRTAEPNWADVDSDVKDMYAKLELDNPGWKNVYFSGRECRQFVLDHFGRRTCEAYDKLVPGAYRADLFRYCAVYVLGGCMRISPCNFSYQSTAT